jgi:hypothetical protein
VADAAHRQGAESFRRLGVPVPEGTTEATLARLDAVLAATGAGGSSSWATCCIRRGARAGHAGRRWRAGGAPCRRWSWCWCAATTTAMPATRRPWGVQAVDEPLRLGPLALLHHPDPWPGAYVLAGHLHPGVVLGGRAHDRLRLPCFHFGPAGGRAAGLRRVHRSARRAARARRPRLRGQGADGVPRCLRRPDAYRLAPMSSLNHLLSRAESLLARLEAVLPHAPAAPDWSRVRGLPLPQARRLRHAGTGAPRGHDPPGRPEGGRRAEGTPAAQHRAVRGRPAGQQRAADRRARHRQEQPDQGLPERIQRRRACA